MSEQELDRDVEDAEYHGDDTDDGGNVLESLEADSDEGGDDSDGSGEEGDQDDYEVPDVEVSEVPDEEGD